MKRLIPLAFMGSLLLLFMSNKNGRAKVGGEGNTGAPGDKSYFCSDCHKDNTYSITLELTIADTNGVAVTSYFPGQTYQITLKIKPDGMTVPAVYGFQMIGLEDKTNTPLNGFLNPVAGTQLTVLKNRQYAEHSKPSASNIFLINWKAPATNLGDVTFYTAMVAANNNGGNTGDKAIKTKITIPSATSSTDNLVESVVSFYPNPLYQQLNISGSFSRIPVQVRMTDLQGKAHLFDYKPALDVSNWAAGVYVVQVLDAEHRVITTRKILKL